MKPMKDIPVYDIVMKDGEDSGMYRISLVTNPAIQENFIYFAEEKDMFFVDDEKGIIVGPVIVPNKPIYRKNESGEYYVQFSVDTIEKMMRQYAIKGLHNSFNIQHQFETDEVYMLEMWMKEGEEDKSKMYGFDLPVGTVFAKAYVKSDVIRDEIKSSGLNGFSIEVKNFDMVEQKFESNMDFKFAVELGERIANLEAHIAKQNEQIATLMELWAEAQDEFSEVAESAEEVKEEVVEEPAQEEVALEEQAEEPAAEEVAEEAAEEVKLEETKEEVVEEQLEEVEAASVEEAELALSAEQEGEEEEAAPVDKTVKFERITSDKIKMIDKFFGKRLY
jgi:hypothetical protein